MVVVVQVMVVMIQMVMEGQVAAVVVVATMSGHFPHHHLPAPLPAAVTEVD